jgi:hypothetical protein
MLQVKHMTRSDKDGHNSPGVGQSRSPGWVMRGYAASVIPS